MSLFSITGAQLAFGHVALLDRTDFSIETNERVGLIGRNGAGKSSLLKIVAQLIVPDDGVSARQQGLVTAYVPQEPVFADGETVFEAVASGLAAGRALLDEFNTVTAQLAETHESSQYDALLVQMTNLQAKLDAADTWQWSARVETLLTQLALDGNALVQTLSGGGQKRVALGAALVARPDLLLLDEPTNHLDFDGMRWLEELLIAQRASVLFITHDRSFLDRVATRIVELDRGRLLSFPGNFGAYQVQKAQQLEVERIENAKFDKLLAQEEVWIRKGVEARRTRSVSRIGRLVEMRTERAQRRSVQGNLKLNASQAEKSGKLVAELNEVSKSYDARVLIKDFSVTVTRGDRIGLIGPNGAGKTTLLKLILGTVPPDQGQARTGTQLHIAYFDQMRARLDPEQTLLETISPGSGERNRLLLAQLFARPSNVLVLDEPTNDLDIPALELLEELLAEYDGTVLLVSHDRTFLDNVVTSVIVAEGGGGWREYVGSFTDWQIQHARAAQSAPAGATKNTGAPASKDRAADRPIQRALKLSYKQQQELSALPAKIAALEAEQKAINEQLVEGSIFMQDAQQGARLAERHAQIEDELLAALERWQALEAK
ncbi:hypothetical protein BGZ97_000018 [Linnemannia gamsii]|uniref:ABC transporter domain-containing protein n=1 Tax=Linnemannia gamsii TaxID=64522 RepID=A0A9P6RPZ3_9FUNG|nr:hypothetical protein BGZ97_000018 [Linnemannia gamsii]